VRWEDSGSESVVLLWKDQRTGQAAHHKEQKGGIEMKHWQRVLTAGLGVIALAVTLVLLALGGQHTLAQGDIIYVDADATEANNGSSWEDAFVDLQPALEVAVPGDQIWVAAGTYYPGTTREDSFAMVNQVAIYGGFDPSVGDVGWADRDWAANETILSGDIGTPFYDGDNCYHVFYHPDGLNLDSSAVLDGFTVASGYAPDEDWSSPHTFGGGMYNYSSSPTLANCTFEDNWAYYGGGMSNRDSSSPTLANCTFEGNSAMGGGGMFNGESSPQLTDCTFEGNSADYGGGMSNDFSSPQMTDCIFEGNSAWNGGGMYNGYGSDPTLTNCTFEDNSAWNGGGMENDDSSPTLTNCIFKGNSVEWKGGGMANTYDSSPTLTNCTFEGNSAAGDWLNAGGGMYNDESSPQMTDCIFKGNSAEEYGGGMANDDSSPTLSNCIFEGNSADYQGGGMRSFNSEPTLTNCTFSGNSASHGGGMYNSAALATLTNCILWGDSPDGIDGAPPDVTYSDVQGGYVGEGNIDADPLFVDPDSGDFHLADGSPCIDAGTNAAPDLPDYDFEGDDRILDGNGDGTATVDMGVDEFELTAIMVLIDIKPGGDPNSLMCYNEKGVITVAILTSPEFDATTVDHTTVTFEGASEIHVDNRSGEPTRHEKDVDRDGDTDLVFHFRLGDTNLTCESTAGTLRGETLDDQAIKGTDAVRMIDPGPFTSPLRNEVNDVE
jgi:parallel beta-helix repeat protein